MEDESEITLIAETNLVTDLGNRPSGGCEQRLGLPYAQVMEIGYERLSCNPPKEPGEMRFAHVHAASGVLDGDHASQGAIDEFEQGAQSFDVVLLAAKCIEVEAQVRVVVHEQDQDRFQKGSRR